MAEPSSSTSSVDFDRVYSSPEIDKLGLVRNCDASTSGHPVYQTPDGIIYHGVVVGSGVRFISQSTKIDRFHA